MQTPAEVAAALQITADAVATRRTAIGIAPGDDAALRAASAAARVVAEPFLDQLYGHMRQQAALAALLASDAQVARLKDQQRRYLDELFTASIDWPYVLRRLWIGVVHHRVHLAPQWYLPTYAHVICDHLPVIFADAPTPAAALERATALVRRVFFDASLGLDAYGRSEEASLWQQVAGASDGPARGSAAAAAGDVSTGAGPAAPSAPAPYSRIRLTAESAAERRQYIGLTADDLARLRDWRPMVTTRTPAVLDDFYGFLGRQADTSALVPGEVADRLKRQVASYWIELVEGAFDRPYAASRMRIGVIHEKIRLDAAWYLAGLARQVTGFMAALDPARPDAVPMLTALIRGVFFDVSFVIDAYMDARADTLLRIDGYAAQLVSGLASAVAVVDDHDRLISANRTLIALSGGDAAMLYMLPLDRALPIPEAAPLVAALRAQMAAGGQPRLAGAGTLGARRLRLTAVALAGQSSAGGTVALVIDDVTDLVRLAADLDRDRAQFDAVADGVGIVLWEMDATTWTVTAINRAVLEVTGLRDVAFLGRPMAWCDRIVEADRDRVMTRLRALRPGERIEVDYRFARADGQEVWLRSTVSAGDGGLLSAASADVTAARRADALRLEAVAAVAGGVAHVVNNCLTGVIGGIELHAAQHGGLDRAPYLRAVLQSTEKAAGMAAHLLAFAGRQRLDPVVLSLSDVCRENAPRVAATLGPHVPVHWELAADVWPCRVDRRMFGHALESLADNARQALGRTGTVRVTTRNRRAADVPPRIDLRGHDWVELAFADTGAGMTDDVRRHAAEPFFSTRSLADASGLGLSMVHGFLMQSGGHVTIESAPGQGTTVTLSFPRVDAGDEASAVAALPRVLFVEDDADVRRVGAAMIGLLGYQVADTGSVAEARRLAALEPFDVLVADIVLGQGTDGADLARELAAAHPDLAVVLVSGYAQTAFDLTTLPPRFQFLPKPLSLAALGASLSRARMR